MQRKRVLYLCWINGPRSMMAEAITNARSNGSIRAYSAGLVPAPAVSAALLALLQERSVPTGSLRVKDVTEFVGPLAPNLDFVITTCDRSRREACPTWPGQPIHAHWNIPEPPKDASPHEIYLHLNAMFEVISRCVDIFLTLPHAAMQRMALSHEIGAIGERVIPRDWAFADKVA